ncbi:MAG: barnase inhibitor [Gammaproteobacteria bacterium]|nr:barnase inhibitor [Gammaproteobacteria bacterium]
MIKTPQNESAWQSIHFLDDRGVRAFTRSAAKGTAFIEADISLVKSDQDLLSGLAVSLEFPDYFGGNWDALDECLTDLEWKPASGYVLIARGARPFWKSNAETGGKLVSAWLYAASEWASEGVPFHLIFVP